MFAFRCAQWLPLPLKRMCVSLFDCGILDLHLTLVVGCPNGPWTALENGALKSLKHLKRLLKNALTTLKFKKARLSNTSVKQCLGEAQADGGGEEMANSKLGLLAGPEGQQR